MKNGRFQAKDIDDVFFLRCVDWCQMCPTPPSTLHGVANPGYYPLRHLPHWVFTWNLEYLMPIFPSEVILAKASALIRRGLLTGCDCGCRGDFELTIEGAQFLRKAGHEVMQGSGVLSALGGTFKAALAVNATGGEA